MAEEKGLIREYEAIIRTMKEQIAVLKARLKTDSRNTSLDLPADHSVLTQKSQELDHLHSHLRTAKERISALSKDRRDLESRLQAAVESRKEPGKMHDKLLYSLYRESELGRVQGEVELKRLREREETLKRENEALRREVVLSKSDREGEVGRYEDLNTTQRARQLFFERKMKRIEGENRNLKDKLVAAEMEKQETAEKSATLAGHLQDFDLLKAKIRKYTEEIQSKEAQIQLLQTKTDQTLSKSTLQNYKTALHSNHSSHFSPSPSRGSSHFASPKSSTDARLYELAFALRKTQDEISQLKRVDKDGRKDMDRHAASPRSMSQEGSRLEGRKKGQMQFSPSIHPSESSKPIGPPTPAAEKPILSKLQLLRAMKKPGVSIFKPTVPSETTLQGLRGAGQRGKLAGR